MTRETWQNVFSRCLRLGVAFVVYAWVLQRVTRWKGGHGEQQMESHPNLFGVLLGIESNYIRWICRRFFLQEPSEWSWIYKAISAICLNFWILSLEAKSGYRDCCCKIGIPIRVIPSPGAFLEVATARSVEKSRSDLGLPASWSWWLCNRRGVWKGSSPSFKLKKSMIKNMD